MFSQRPLLFFIAFYGICVSCYGQLPQNGLLAYYTLDNDALDRSGNNNNGQQIGGIERTTDRFGNTCGALKFNGKNGYISVPNSGSLQSPDGALTIAVWVKLEAYAIGAEGNLLPLICKGNRLMEGPANPQYRLLITQSESQSILYMNSAEKPFIYSKKEDNKWHFYVLTYNGALVSFYVDNNLLFQAEYSGPFVKNNDALEIGRDMAGGAKFFAGALDDLRIYNRALSLEEINALAAERAMSNFDDDFVLGIPPNIERAAEPGKCSAKVDYENPTVTIHCGEADVVLLNGKKSGSYFDVGESTVSFWAMNDVGRKQTCSFEVIVKDRTPPTLTCPVNVPAKCALNADGAKVYYMPPTATDNCTNVTTELVSGLPSGSMFPKGSTTITYRATDKSGNKSNCSFQVIVGDDRKPEITCPEDIFVTIGLDKTDTALNYSDATSVYNPSIFELKKIGGIESGGKFPLGINTVTYQAINTYGTSSICAFTVNVRHPSNPIIQGIPLALDSRLNLGNDTVKYINEISKLESCVVTLLIYDGGFEDNDSVSVIFNGQVLADHDMLHSRKMNTLENIIKRTVTLEKGKPNYLISKAWNTGKTWPNTMTIDIYNGEITSENEMRGKQAIRKIIEAIPGVAGGIVFTCGD